jgi:hypothetical protein
MREWPSLNRRTLRRSKKHKANEVDLQKLAAARGELLEKLKVASE